MVNRGAIPGKPAIYQIALHRIISSYLLISAPRQLADNLLASASPSQLCGSNAAPETAQACLSALRAAATAQVWRNWVKQGHDDPALAEVVAEAKPWWQLWRRG